MLPRLKYFHLPPPMTSSSSTSSSKQVASWRDSSVLLPLVCWAYIGSTVAATVWVLAPAGVVLVRDESDQKSGVAVADGTFPPRSDGDDGEGGLMSRDGARGPLQGTEATLLLCPLPSTLDLICSGISLHRRRLYSAAGVASTVSNCSDSLSCRTMTTEPSPVLSSSSSLTVLSSRKVFVHSTGCTNFIIIQTQSSHFFPGFAVIESNLFHKMFS